MHHNSTLPPQIQIIFTTNNTVHHHNTRHSNDPHIPQHSSQAFSHGGIQVNA